MRVAVTGASGLLGRQLIPRLREHRHEVIAAAHHKRLSPDGHITALPFDLEDDASIEQFVIRGNADCIIHSAAMTDVDECERAPDRANRCNALATAVLSTIAQRHGIRVIYLSTDYVFDGQYGPYDELDPPNPINEYGRTKLAGEEHVVAAASGNLVVRAASFLGNGRPGSPTFAERMVDCIRSTLPLQVAVDQMSNITPVEFLAEGIIELLTLGASGVRHVTPGDVISRFEFARLLARAFGATAESVEGVPYGELRRAASRPLNGGLVTRFPLNTQCPPLEVSVESFKSRYLAADKH